MTNYEPNRTVLPAPTLPSEQELTEIESTELHRHEQTIREGLRTFVAVGTALTAIRDQRLYRATHRDFESYCEDRWDIKRSYANKLIRSREVVDCLGPIVPTVEAQCRPLTPLLSLGEEVVKEVWDLAVEKSNLGSDPNAPPMTAKLVSSAVEQQLGRGYVEARRAFAKADSVAQQRLIEEFAHLLSLEDEEEIEEEIDSADAIATFDGVRVDPPPIA